MIKKILIGLFVLALLPQLAQAQFGKNLAVYDKINWKIYESEHFEIYYYFPNKDDWAKEKEYLADMVRWTETAYSKIKQEINYDQPNQPIYDAKTKKARVYNLKPFYDSEKKKYYKPRIFFFWSRFHADHHPLFGPWSGIAYAENQQMRMVGVSKEYPDDLIQRIVIHETCHLFQFDLWGLAKKSPSQLSPLERRLLTFLFEGWSQHISGLHRAMPSTQLIIKYFVLDKILRYVNIKDWVRYSDAYEVCYILAGYLYDYIKETYGPDTFSIFVKEFRRAKPTAQGFEKNVNRVLKTDLAELDRGFRKYMEDQYKHFPIEKKEAFEYGRDILLQRVFFNTRTIKSPRDPYDPGVTVPGLPKKKVDAIYEPVVSPSGNLVVGFIEDGDTICVALIDKNNGTLVKKLTGGYSLYKYGLFPIVDLDGSGRTLSFSPDGKNVLYFAQTAGRNPVLVLINFTYKKTTKKKAAVRYHDIHAPVTVTVPELALINKKIRKIEIELDDPESPEMSKGGKAVIFSAILNGQRDIFSLNLETREVKNLTNDKNWDYGPSFSPDEKSLIYVSDIGGYKKLFALNLETQEKKQLTFGESNETRPIYTQDGKTIFFISDSDKDKTRNIYSLDIENNKINQWTDVISGVRTVVPLASNKLLFGAVGYRDSEHFFSNNLYEMDLDKSQAVASVNNLFQEVKKPETTPIEIPEVDPKKIKKYSTKFHLDQAMFYGGTSNFYGWYGMGYAYLSDLTNTKHIQANILTFGDQYKYNTFSYFDISRRLSWGAVISFEDHHFWPWFVDWGYNPYGNPAMDEVLYYLRFKRTKLDAIVQYPLDLCHRFEFSLSGTSIKYDHPDWQAFADYYASEIEKALNDPLWQLVPKEYLEQYLASLSADKESYELRAAFLEKYINDGKFLTLNLAFVRDTSLYKQMVGPLTNDRYRFDLSWSTGGHNITASAEARKYLRLGSEWVFAFRGYAGAQWGKTITPWLVGDLGELRGYEWMQFMGNRIWLTNFELRLPLTKNFNLFGLYLGDIRAALFCDLAKIWFDDKRFNVLNRDDINSGLVKGSIGIDLGMPLTFWIFGSEVHLAFSKRMTEVKFLPSFEKKWQVKLYFGYSW